MCCHAATRVLLDTYFFSFASSGLTLEEAFQMAYEDDVDIDQIYIEPPDPGAVTDEDSGGEDEAGFVDNLSRNQLNSNVEIHMRRKDSKGAKNVNSNDLGSVDSHDAERVNVCTDAAEKIDYSKIDWIKGDLEEGLHDVFEED